MKPAEIKAELRTIADELLASGGVSPLAIVARYKKNVGTALLIDLGADAVDDLLRRWAKDIVDHNRNASNAQLSFEGFGTFDETVTTVGVDGEPTLKLLRHATAEDCRYDLELHHTNERLAIEARRRAEQRNLVFLPLMEEHGFATVGEAIEHLTARATP